MEPICISDQTITTTTAVCRYSREDLLHLRHQAPRYVDSGTGLVIPAELRRKRRGCRGGKKVLGRRKRRSYLPSVVMGNLRSLGNKTEELSALTRTQREFKNSCLLCFTETWLEPNIPDSFVGLEGFCLVRADRTAESGKKRGGGVAVFVNQRWSHEGHVSPRKRLCNRDLELLVVGVRPYYLPREFSHVLLFCVYIPPSADAASACEQIHCAVSEEQTRCPRALFIISGDFNHADLSGVLPAFTQYVTCPTRGNRTLDLLYSNVKDGYTCAPLPPLGRSDHSLVLLMPHYIPVVRREPAVKRSVKLWTEEAGARLQDCFNTTDWSVFTDEAGEDIDGLTQRITDYCLFCEETIVPTRRVRCFSNNPPWVTPELKALLNQKKKAFRSGDREEQKRIQRELQWRIRRSKKDYAGKMEEKLAQGNVRDVWRGLKDCSGAGSSRGAAAGGDQQWANTLNLHFNRFDISPPSPAPLRDLLPLPPLPPPPPPPAEPPALASCTSTPSTPETFGLPPPLSAQSSLSFTPEEVRAQLKRLKQRKSPGPDGISPRLLRTCADQLCEVLCYIYNLSLSLGKVPVLWKTSCLVPVPKTSHAKEPNHFRPVALTSHLMKTLERLVLSFLRSVVSPTLDPLQFAYRNNIGVEDAILYLLQRALTYTEAPRSVVRVMFFDFSSAFNTIRPALLRGKLEDVGVDSHLAAWTIDYLTDRPQYVRLRGCESDVVVCSTGAPQGTVLSPFLFTVYTSDFTCDTNTCHLQKFSDDSAIVGCVSEGNEQEYRSTIRDFVDWCESNFLCLNTSKTKELVIDFRRKPPPLPPVNIQGQDIEIVDSFKYLGVHINNNLDWSHNTNALYKKGQSRLFLLRRLSSFGVSRPLLKTFYDSMVASVLFYAVVCWAPSSTERDRNRLNKLVRRAGSALGCPLDSIEEVCERRMLSKLTSIMDDTSHPLHRTVAELCSSFSGRLRHPQCKKERYRRSFIPTAVRLYNKSVQ